ncbi:transglycosylase domain-containing protein [Kitasatospora sp. A2-31]|uniref:transglycosylase domain-containing protein n=1 Tax=Kitasatospora sp. A2-31 TaxID=2916414 RepID=UPI001EE9EC5A|nr:transglycosylase domain-containing protein [Kitasatospora sp. A2-31]MCG6494638.1 penicillin-binding protein [Kitasatospora sp. A2-31]
MSERRRRSPNGDGQPPGDGGGTGGADRDELSSEGFRRRSPGVRETAQQPRMTRAEMRKAAAKGGGKRGAGAPASAAGRDGKPGKKRFIDYPRFGKQGFRRWLPSWRLWLSTFLIVFAACVGTVFFIYQSTTIPPLKDLVKEQNNIYYWADGTEMTRKGETNRQIVELSDISPNLQNAVIAAENESFRTDSGIDPKGMLRAVYNMAKGGQTQGASTITQQYVKNAYLTQEQTLTRKVKEFFITLKVNQDMKKEEILKGYLNTSWFGRGTGAQAAAQAYYGVNAKDLDLCQSAMLAGLLKGAALYDPSIKGNHERAEVRWKWILDRMVETKNATAEERAKCTTFPDPIKPVPPTNMNGQISYLVDVANRYVTAKDPKIDQQALAKGGYKIYTTFEKDKVDALKKAVDDVRNETLNPQKRPDNDNWVQFGAASIRPGDGAIVAIYGGDGVENQHFDNNADAQGVQVGSTFKPFVLAAAMQVGVQTATDDKGKPKRINADSRYLSDDMSEIRRPDGSLIMDDTTGKPYRQKNEDKGKRGYVSLRQAMQWSYNVPFVQLNQDVGGQNVADIAEKMGVRKESFVDTKTTTFPLGTSGISPIRMADAYATLAASGKQADPYSVTKVELNGVERPGFKKPELKQALEPAVADNVTDVLVNVAKNGTGSKSNALGRPVAGKTGTTDQNKSAWWVGYTPQLATSVAMWREDPAKHERLSLNGTGGKDSVHGGDTPTDVFTRYMKAALANEKKLDFPSPQPVGSQVDSSGAPSTATPSTSPSATETAPTQTADPGAPQQPQPTATQGPACVPGVDCPGTVPTPSATKTHPTPGGGGSGGGGGGGGQTSGPSPTCILGICTSPQPTQSSPTSSTSPSGKPPKPTTSPSATGAGGAQAAP